jgi:hypothetical protein
MSRSFQSAAKKCTNKLDLVKLTPMPDEDSKPENVYKRVPLVDSQTGETICSVCIKYWHNKQSSLSSTIDSKETASKRSVSESPDSFHSSSTLQIESVSSVSAHQQNIPIHSPVYFFISSENQSFIQALNQIIQ